MIIVKNISNHPIRIHSKDKKTNILIKKEKELGEEFNTTYLKNLIANESLKVVKGSFELSDEKADELEDDFEETPKKKNKKSKKKAALAETDFTDDPTED